MDNKITPKIYNDKKDCCGCTACMTVCPKNAISMIAYEKGFLYPNININKCVKCGLCTKICVFKNGYDTYNNFDIPLVYAVKHKNKEERKTSRSGGMFIAIADYILCNNGIIYGAGYSDKFYVIHKRATNKQELFEFKGSKYVQSDMNTIFSQVIQDLKNDNYVLFSGTPCQTAGLYSCLKNINTERLFVCDIVCHGTPSPYIWKDYLEYIKEKHKSQILSVDFRNKSYGWNTHIESFYLQNGKNISSNLYAFLFCKNIMFRPSCKNCKYANTKRPSDITLADFWGIDKAAPNFNDNNGVSLVFLNTQKGKFLFEQINDSIEYKSSKLSDCIQPNLQHPSTFSDDYDSFWGDYISKGFIYVSKKYGNNNIKGNLKHIAKKILRKSTY